MMCGRCGEEIDLRVDRNTKSEVLNPKGEIRICHTGELTAVHYVEKV